MATAWRSSLLSLIAATLAAAGARAAGLADLPGLEIIGPEEILEHHTVASPDGDIRFRQADGAWVRLVTSTTDPEIRNSGDGAFFPADLAEVERALRALPGDLIRELEVRIYLLPYPRSGMLGSSADGRAIYLTPGVRAYSAADVHYLVAHEMGHAFHRRHLPYDDAAGWARYRELRGLEDGSRYRFDGPHADRPQEIFAEDFRVLFGGAVARGSGAVENNDVAHPDHVPGLREYYRSLAQPWPSVEDLAERVPLSLAPQPVRAGSSVWLRSPDAIEVDAVQLFDATGRNLPFRRVDARADGVVLVLEDDVPAGAYWIRVELARGVVRSLPLRVLSH